MELKSDKENLDSRPLVNSTETSDCTLIDNVGSCIKDSPRRGKLNTSTPLRCKRKRSNSNSRYTCKRFFVKKDVYKQRTAGSLPISPLLIERIVNENPNFQSDSIQILDSSVTSNPNNSVEVISVEQNPKLTKFPGCSLNICNSSKETAANHENNVSPIPEVQGSDDEIKIDFISIGSSNTHSMNDIAIINEIEIHNKLKQNKKSKRKHLLRRKACLRTKGRYLNKNNSVNNNNCKNNLYIIDTIGNDVIDLNSPVKQQFNPDKDHFFSNEVGQNLFNAGKVQKEGLRPIIIDGCNVAFAHGRNHFSWKGLLICIQYFLQRKHSVTAFVPNFRRPPPNSEFHQITDSMEKSGIIAFTPSRKVEGKLIVPYDDRFIIQCAALKGGIIVSTDNYRDLINENKLWKQTVEERLLMFTWVDDMIMFPQDPLGRKGPKLDEFLLFPK